MNKYEILSIIGEGAYGVVLKCRNRDTNETLAIKKFKETEEDEVVRRTIQREIKMLKALRHKNIVGLVEAFKRKGRIYLVFEYVEKNLLEVLEEKTSGLDAETIRRVIFQMLKALHHCHKHDIIHRDIKPENILINADGMLKLCDFGFARSMPPKPHETITDYVATRWYRSPELVLSDPHYSFPIDMWAVACIMGELIDGQPLFPGDNEMDQLHMIQKLLGPLTEEQYELFNKNSRFAGSNFQQIQKEDSIERRYLGKISQKALSFMKALLKMDPKERLNVVDAMAHPYFDGVREMYTDERRGGGDTAKIHTDEQGRERIVATAQPNRPSGDQTRSDHRRYEEDEEREAAAALDRKVKTPMIHHENEEKSLIYAKISGNSIVGGSDSQSALRMSIGGGIAKNFYSTNKLNPQFSEAPRLMKNALYNYSIEKLDDSSSGGGGGGVQKRNSSQLDQMNTMTRSKGLIETSTITGINGQQKASLLSSSSKNNPTQNSSASSYMYQQAGISERGGGGGGGNHLPLPTIAANQKKYLQAVANDYKKASNAGTSAAPPPQWKYQMNTHQPLTSSVRGGQVHVNGSGRVSGGELYGGGGGPQHQKYGVALNSGGGGYNNSNNSGSNQFNYNALISQQPPQHNYMQTQVLQQKKSLMGTGLLYKKKIY